MLEWPSLIGPWQLIEHLGECPLQKFPNLPPSPAWGSRRLCLCWLIPAWYQMVINPGTKELHFSWHCLSVVLNQNWLVFTDMEGNWLLMGTVYAYSRSNYHTWHYRLHVNKQYHRHPNVFVLQHFLGARQSLWAPYDNSHWKPNIFVHKASKLSKYHNTNNFLSGCKDFNNNKPQTKTTNRWIL